MAEIRVIHTSDMHIGAPFLFLGKKGNEQRLAIREALARITRIAREGKYHALLIAGDLFDSAFGASEADVSGAVRCCAEAGPACQVVILPGSHDFYAAGSLFERERARFEASGNVHVLTPERRVIEFPELSLAVHGMALTSASAPENAFLGLKPIQEYRWNICMAHGSVEGYSAALEPRENAFRMNDLASGFDYVALGHWHSYLVVKERSPAAVYCGSPEIIARDQRGAGSVVSLACSDGGVTFERLPVGSRRVADVAVDCTGLANGEEFVNKVLGTVAPDRNLILDLSLTGLLGIDASFDPVQAVAELEQSYFSVKLAGKGPGREISKEELLAIPGDTVAGTFVRILLRKIEHAEGERRELLEEALQLGYQLFKGRDLIG
jgi:DNA repair exonuclease SbcCD nuclease subunit